MTCSRADLRAMINNNLSGTFDATHQFPKRTSIWKKRNMDRDQKAADTMQLHKRRFEYLDNKVKGLQYDCNAMQEGMARIKRAIES